MPGLFAIQFPYALLLASAPVSDGPATLPAGNDSVFRARMLEWSAEAPAPPERIEIGQAANTPLPKLSSRFGYRVDPVRGGRAMHDGIDIPGAMGSPVRAAEGGTVRFAGLAGGYGNMVEIAHSDGLATRYAHLSRMLVRPGAQVARGEVIALMGSTGRSTGSHLHFEVRAHGRAIDPLGALGAGPGWAPHPYRPVAAAPHLSAYARARAERADR